MSFQYFTLRVMTNQWKEEVTTKGVQAGRADSAGEGVSCQSPRKHRLLHANSPIRPPPACLSKNYRLQGKDRRKDERREFAKESSRQWASCQVRVIVFVHLAQNVSHGCNQVQSMEK